MQMESEKPPLSPAEKNTVFFHFRTDFFGKKREFLGIPEILEKVENRKREPKSEKWYICVFSALKHARRKRKKTFPPKNTFIKRRPPSKFRPSEFLRLKFSKFRPEITFSSFSDISEISEKRVFLCFFPFFSKILGPIDFSQDSKKF